MKEVNQFLGTIPDWILILFTTCSFAMSIISLNISRKSYKLDEKNHSRLAPNIKAEHIGSYWELEEQYYIYTIKIRLCNLAHASNSIKNVQLKVRYYKEGNENSIIFDEDRSINCESVTMHLDSGNTKDLMGKFKIHKDFVDSIKIKSYQVNMIDIYNNKYSVEISIISKEHRDEKK